MQAITVRILPPTNTKPARVQARATAGKGPVLSVSAYDGYDDAIRAAAKGLAEKYGWKGRYFLGNTHDGRYVFVNADPFRTSEFTV